MLSYNNPSSRAEVVVVGNNEESSADEKMTAMGRHCNSCGMQSVALPINGK
jgi:hypothetical protein